MKYARWIETFSCWWGEEGGKDGIIAISGNDKRKGWQAAWPATGKSGSRKHVLGQWA